MPQSLPENTGFVSLTRYLDALPVAGRRLLIFLVLALWAALAWTVWTVYFPPGECYELTEETTFSVVAQKVENMGRTFYIGAEAATAAPSFGAKAVLPSDASLILFVALLMVGWAAMTAATAHVSGPFAYIFYFFFCVAIYQSEVARWVGGTVGDWREKAVAFGFMLLYLIPAYLFRSRIWVKSLPFQFGFWLLWMGLWYGVQGAAGGLAALHRAATYPTAAYVLLLVLAALYVSKDVLQAVVLALNHAADVRRRRPASAVFGVAALVVVALLFTYLRAYSLLPDAEGFALRPLWFFVFAAGFSFLLSQNFYPPFQRHFSSPLGFAMLIVGGATVPAAAWGYYAAAGESVFAREAERLVATLFLPAAVVQFFYLLRNHGGDLQLRRPVYFNLPHSKTNFVFAAVWFVPAAVLIVQSGRQNWHNFYGFYVSTLNQYADEAWRKGEPDQALLWYEQATEYNMADPKSNHNWATLSASTFEALDNAETFDLIDRRFAEADRVNDFVFAAMGRGNFLRVTYRQKQAAALLKTAAGRRKDYRLYCNLAAAYLGVEKPDSARWALGEAERLAPREPTVLAALAACYMRMDSTEIAWKYARAAFEKAPKHSLSAQNYCAVALSRDTVPDVSAFSARDTATLAPSAAYAVALGAIRAGEHEKASALLEPLTPNRDPDVHYAYFLARLPLDEPTTSLSRRNWLVHHFPEYAPALERALAVRCFEKNAPDCAADYFRAAGTVQDRFFAALMDLDAGDDFRAYDTLMALAAQYDDLRQACKREMAMLEAAHKTGHESLIWDFADITSDEALRLGRYAGRIGHWDVATPAFEAVVKADSLTVAPFLVWGKVLSLNGDPGAGAKRFLAGLSRDPKNFALRYELARAYHYAGRKKSADSLLSLLDDQRLRLELYPQPLALRDYALKNPWDDFAVRTAAKYLVEKDSVEAGLRLMHKVLDFNRRRAEWWAFYGYFNEKTGFSEEAEFGFQKAWENEIRDTLKKRYFDDYERLRKMRAQVTKDDGDE